MALPRICITLAAFATFSMPVLAEDALLAEGRAAFAAHCSACHGVDGTGHGPKAGGLAHQPSDLTRIAARHGGRFPADRVFETIAGLDMPDQHGTREMPVWGDVFVSEAVGDSVSLNDALKASDAAARRIAGLVAYLEAIQAAP